MRTIDYGAILREYAPEMPFRDYMRVMHGLYDTIRNMAIRENVVIITATQAIHNTPAEPVVRFHKLRQLKLY